MEYNKKEQLFDKITGLMINNPCLKEKWINEGISEVFKRTENFFNKELVPEVPQYVADWYEENKDNLDYNLWNYIMDWEDQEDDVFKNWFNNSKEAFKTIINMHQFGYKINKEKRYLVKMKNLRSLFCYLAYIQDEGYWTLMASGGESIIIKHTHKELEEAGFGEVFNSPLFEVEEVTK